MSSKAVLIFDIPDSCADCALNYGCSYCRVMNKTLDFATMCKKRPDWCPLIKTTKADITRAKMFLDRIENERSNRL